MLKSNYYLVDIVDEKMVVETTSCSSSMFYFTRAVPTGWAFLQGTLGMFLCVIQIQGEMEPDDIQLEACSTFLPPEKK